MASDADDDDASRGSYSDEESSGTDNFDEDLAAISRACTLTGADPNDLLSTAKPLSSPGGDIDSDSDEDDDELLRGTYQRYSEAPLNLLPLNTLPPAASDEDENGFESDEEEDDLAILRGVEHRCEAYFTGFVESGEENKLKTSEQILDSSVAFNRETSFDLVADKNYVSEGFPDSLDVYSHSQKPELFTDAMNSPSGLIESHHQENHDVSILPPPYSRFPKSAHMLVNSINKNRACQKFIRSKLIQIQARIEENEKLMRRVKILKDFQASCKRRTGRALSQKKDARLQLILARKSNMKINGKKNPALYNGPEENPHVANYKRVLTKFPISLSREKWTEKEKDNLAQGIKQQIQDLLVQKSVDLIRNMDGTSSQDIDSIYASIGDLDITPEQIRSFLPKVNWKRLVSLYVPGRSGEECEARWLNFEDPLINHNPWEKMEEKKLLYIIQEKGIENWIDIAVSLGTNRTPSQCLAHYQRSLNPSILKREWTEDEDEKLRAAVEECGESNWQVVASFLEGRTGTQCSNRWIKTLHPARKMLGRWTSDEDKRLTVAVMLFGPKSWREIAKFVPGRTHVQCRERWSNSLDPNVNMDKWSEDEDERLIVAFREHLRGFIDSGKDQLSWAKVATGMPGRTDNQCRRRALRLFPKLKAVLRDAKNMQARLGLRNFVDRESERPALALNDFIPRTLIDSVLEPENTRRLKKLKKKRRSRSKRPAKGVRNCPQEVPLLTNGDARGEDAIQNKKKVLRPCPKRKEGSEPIEDMTKNHKGVSQSKVGLRKSSLGRLIKRPREVDASSSDDALNGRERKHCQKKHKRTRHTDIQPLGSELPFSHQEEDADLGGAEEGLSLQLRRGAQIYPEEVLTYDKEVQNFRCDLNSKRRIRKHSLGSKTYVNNELSDSATVSDDDEPLAKIVHRKRRALKARARKTRAVSHSKSPPFHPPCSETRESDDETETLSLVSISHVNYVLSDSDTVSDEDEPLAIMALQKRRRTNKACSRKTSAVSHSRSLPLHPPCTETREANDAVKTQSENNTSMGRKRTFHKVYTRRRKDIGQSGQPQYSTLAWLEVAESQSKQSESVKVVKSSNFGTSLNDKSSAVALPQNGKSRLHSSCNKRRPKRSRDRDDSRSEDVLEEDDSEEMTLATFIKGKVKKKMKLAGKGSDQSGPCHLGVRELPQAMQSCQAEEHPGCNVASPYRERLKEGGTSNNDSFCVVDDHLSDSDSPPPGFEHPIYRKEVT